MGIFGKKKSAVPAESKKDKPAKVPAEVVVDKKPAAKAEAKADRKAETKAVLKGTSVKAYSVLLKPLITEKATELGALNKYVFAVAPKMNKVEIKKAIRTVYKVEPLSVAVMNFAGKHVRYGKTSGKTKKWKKAIITLKAGDSIQVYEGV